MPSAKQSRSISLLQTINFVTMAARMQTDETKVRDTNHYTDQRRMSDSFRLLIKKYFPDIEQNVYRVPPLFLGRSNVMSERQKSKHSEYKGVECGVYQSNYTYAFGDQAEMRVAECIENVLKEDNSGPALILTSYKYKNFFDNRYENEKGKSDGESDITIIHQTYGCIFIEVKSAKTDIAAPLSTAIKGCKKNMSFFEKNFHFPSFATVAVPNVTKENLLAFIRNCKSLVDYFKCDEQNALAFCLCDDNLPSYNTSTTGFHERKTQLKQWWDSVKAEVKQRNLQSPAFTVEEYKYIFERFVGEKSTVEARSFGQSIKAVGDRYENFVLTPDQVAILNSNVKRLIIRGGYGTGKTIMLILKCRELIKLEKKVCVISMANSPLIDYLEASVGHNLGENYTQNVMFMSAESQSDLTDKLTKMEHEQRHVFIDEFPSEITADESLSNKFATYPEHLMLWCIMAREKLASLSKGVRNTFRQEDVWEEVVLKQVLRCPLPISTQYTFDPYTLITNYKQGHINDTTDELNCVAEYFYSSGLVTEEIKRLAGTSIKKSNIQSDFKWCGLKVVDVSNTRNGTFYSLLKEFGVPLTQQLENQPVAHYTTDIVHFSSGTLEAYTGPSFIVRLKDNDRTKKMNIPFEIDCSQDEKLILMEVLDNLGVTTVEMDIELKKKGITDRPKPKLSCMWPDIIFIEKPETYVFLEKLGVPVSTNKESRDCALFTNSEDTNDGDNCFTIRFDGSCIQVCHPRLKEGPHIKNINHIDHDGTLDHCTTCQNSLVSIFKQLGVDCSSKEPDVSWDDVIILDDRANGRSAKQFFTNCVPLLIDRTEDDRIATLNNPQFAEGVLYIKTTLFQGMERKVVVVLKTPKKIRSPVENRLTDHIELAISRCTSLLILIDSDQ